MSAKRTKIRCAVYTRKSHEEGLDQEFNSLDAQRQSSEAYIESQRHEGWQCLDQAIRRRWFLWRNNGSAGDSTSCSTTFTPDRIDCVVVYKVDRLSRSLLDFAPADRVDSTNTKSRLFRSRNSSTPPRRWGG